MKLSRLLLAAAAAAVTPVALAAPRPEQVSDDTPDTIAELVSQAKASGLQGWDLVDHVTGLVHQRYRHTSVWHLWESPHTSYRNRRGSSNQYNWVLAAALTGCGFPTELVHASRVRMDRTPWWNAGHTWVRVTHDGRQRDACAAKASNRAGDVGFTPVSTVHPFRRHTYVNTSLGLAPFVVAAVWRSWLDHEPVPRWVMRPFGEPVTDEETGA